jgi:hypothetical protein
LIEVQRFVQPAGLHGQDQNCIVQRLVRLEHNLACAEDA